MRYRKGQGQSLTTIIGIIIILVIVVTIIMAMYGGKSGFLRKVGEVSEDFSSSIFRSMKSKQIETGTDTTTSMEDVTREFTTIANYLKNMPAGERCGVSYSRSSEFEKGYTITLLNSKVNNKPIVYYRLFGNGQFLKEEIIENVQACIIRDIGAVNFHKNWIQSRCSSNCRHPEYINSSVTIKPEGELLVDGVEVEWVDNEIGLLYKPTSDLICFVIEKEVGWNIGCDPIEDDGKIYLDDCLDRVRRNMRSC